VTFLRSLAGASSRGPGYDSTTGKFCNGERQLLDRDPPVHYSHSLRTTYLALGHGQNLGKGTTVMKRIAPPEWLRTTAFFTVGHHEPLIFRQRRGRSRVDEAELYRAEHTVENLRRLRREGVNLIRTHFFKGFGLQAERQEIEIVREMARSAHELGIRIETYIQFGSIMYETFFLEKPEARDWIQIDQDGRPMRLCYEAQSFRFLPCYNNEGWLRYMEEVVRVAVEEVKADIIAFDNYDINIAPETCHCHVCVEKFREYLRRKYALDTASGRERLRDRCGLTDVTYVEPPVYTIANPVRGIRTIAEPMQQEWIDFVCESKALALYRFAQYGRSLRGDLAVNCNAMKGPADNMYFLRGVDIEAVCQSAHVFSSEEGHQQGLTEAGVVVTRIRTYKTGRAFGAPCWVASRALSRRHALLGHAEIAAYSAPLRMGMSSILPHHASEDSLRWRSFFLEHADLFLGTETCATVAVLRSRASLAYNNCDTYRAVILAEQALIEAKVPFDIVMDSNLADLSRYRALVLANVESMSEEQADLLKKFLRSGRGLVVTDDTGRYDQWRRTRPESVFASLRTKAERDAAGYERAAYGRGRIAFLDELEPAVAPPPNANHFDDRYWLPPKNAEAFLAAVRWSAGDAFPLSVEAPRAVTVELLMQEQPRRLLLHLLNYDVEHSAQLTATLRLPQGATVTQVRLLSPDGPRSGGGSAVLEGDFLGLELEKLDIYSLVAIDLAGKERGTKGAQRWQLKPNGRG